MNVNIYPMDESLGGDLMKFCIREARVELPDWYKSSNSYTEESNTPFKKDRRMTMKKCMPIVDYLSTGINLHTPYAIYAEGTYPNRLVESASSEEMFKISQHSINQVQKMPIPEEYDPVPLKIEFPYSIETPLGFSSMFLGYSDQKDFPLMFPTAIVQTDKYRAPVNFPFFIRKDFQGKIDAGSMFMKVIFIKRESFDINYMNASDDKGRILQHRKMVGAFGSGFYKKLRLNKI